MEKYNVEWVNDFKVVITAESGNTYSCELVDIVHSAWGRCDIIPVFKEDKTMTMFEFTNAVLKQVDVCKRKMFDSWLKL